MTDALVIALAQLNPTVGDIQGNLARIRDARAAAGAADLLVCAELALIGYPPEDLVMRPAVIEATRRAVEELAADTRTGPAILVTTPWRDGGAIYNAVVAARRRPHCRGAIQARAAQLRRVRRETRLCRGSVARRRRLPRGSPRRPDLRGHLVPDGCRPSRDAGRRDPDRAQWVAVRAREGRPAHRPVDRSRA